MGKALLIYGPSPLGTGTFFPLGGTGHWGATESRSQFRLSEGATFSGLAWRATGASGTNTMRFRKNAANGAQVATRAGPGLAEDTTNSDAVISNDLVNYSWTDTGTDPAIIFARSNVEFTSGHGNIHICAQPSPGVNIGFSATRYFPLSGVIEPPEITIATAQWKNRGYTSCKSLQVNVLTNARVNNTTFKINVNGANVGDTITVGAGSIGIFEVTNQSISLSDGDLICVEWSSGVGNQEFYVASIGAVLKSTGGASETWAHKLQSAGYTRTASATPSYLKLGGSLATVATEAEARIKVGFACRARNLRTYIQTNTYSGAATLKLFVNGSAVLTTTLGAGVTGWLENEVDALNLDDNDEACFEIVGGTSGSCVFRAVGLTFGSSTTDVETVSSEYGHDITSASVVVQSESTKSAEYGVDVQSAALTQVNIPPIKSAEFGFEAASAALAYGAGVSVISVNAEFDHEMQAAALVVDANIIPGRAEFDHEIKGAALAVDSSFISVNAEFDHEMQAAALTADVPPDPPGLPPPPSIGLEMGWESNSPGLSQIPHALEVQGAEYGSELQFATLATQTGVIPVSAEFGFEIQETIAGGFQCDAFQLDAFQNNCEIFYEAGPDSLEFGFECGDVGEIGPSVGFVESSEFGWECGNAGISQLANVVPGDIDTDFGWETVSVSHRVFAHNRTPTHRRRYVIE